MFNFTDTFHYNMVRKHQLNQYPEFNSVEDLVKQGDDSWGYKQYILSMKKQRNQLPIKTTKTVTMKHYLYYVQRLFKRGVLV